MALFGNASTANNTQTTNPFGIPAASIPVLFPNPPAGSTSLFGASANAQPIQQQTRTLFGQPSQQPQAGSSFFGGNAATTNLFQTPQQQQPATTSMFGTTGGTQNQQPSTTGLFGAPSNVQNQQAQQFQQQQPQQQPQQIGSILGYSLGNKVWNEQDMQPSKIFSSLSEQGINTRQDRNLYRTRYKSLPGNGNPTIQLPLSRHTYTTLFPKIRDHFSAQDHKMTRKSGRMLYEKRQTTPQYLS